jgi:hypothetical protein
MLGRAKHPLTLVKQYLYNLCIGSCQFPILHALSMLPSRDTRGLDRAAAHDQVRLRHCARLVGRDGNLSVLNPLGLICCDAKAIRKHLSDSQFPIHRIRVVRAASMEMVASQPLRITAVSSSWPFVDGVDCLWHPLSLKDDLTTIAKLVRCRSREMATLLTRRTPGGQPCLGALTDN